MGRNRLKEPSYTAVHLRLRNWRGPARNYTCVDCGGRAEQWSLNNDTANIVYGEYHSHGLTCIGAYSYDTEDYSPRCIECHLKHDGKSFKECGFSECDKRATAKGLCPGHYQQQSRGTELRPLRKRDAA